METTIGRMCKSIHHRLVLIIGIFLLFVLSCYIPGRIYFIEVDGNVRVSTERILNILEVSGVDFGSNGSSLNSDRLKNQLLSEIDLLKWAGIKVSGCVLRVSVEEKDFIEQPQVVSPVSNIIASRDGIIISNTTLKGTALCKPGDAVIAGQILISGYTDCGTYISATQASGEVTAKTSHKVECYTLKEVDRRTQKTTAKNRYALRLGKKVIKFYKDSGIPNASCVKIQKEKSVCLPGNFVLPVTWITESYTDYHTIVEAIKDTSWLESFCIEYLKTQMNAGQILGSVMHVNPNNSAATLCAEFNCVEMIGQHKNEEITKVYGINE